MNSKKQVLAIPAEQTHEWLLNKHYAKRIPNILYSFGLYENKILVGLCTFGIPASPSLCIGICGEEYKNDVLELNRLVINDGCDKNSASFLVSRSLNMLPSRKIVVSYADTSMGHIGYVYQACNFIYTGLSDAHAEWREIGSNKHSKNVCKEYTLEERQSNPEKFIEIQRPRKHRYIIFTPSKGRYGSMVKRELIQKLKYPILPYPKGDTHRYDASYSPDTQPILFS